MAHCAVIRRFVSIWRRGLPLQRPDIPHHKHQNPSEGVEDAIDREFNDLFDQWRKLTNEILSEPTERYEIGESVLLGKAISYPAQVNSVIGVYIIKKFYATVGGEPHPGQPAGWPGCGSPPTVLPPRNGSELSAENGAPLNADRHSVAAIRSAARPDGRVTEGRLAYARKGLAVGQPFTKTTEEGKSPDRERSGWHDKAGFCAQVPRILAQVPRILQLGQGSTLSSC